MKTASLLAAALGSIPLLAACAFETGGEPASRQTSDTREAPEYSSCGTCCDGTGNPVTDPELLQTCYLARQRADAGR